MNAKGWLNMLRAGDPQYKISEAYMQQALKQEGLSLSKIGTSEKELNELGRLGNETAISRLTRQIHNGVERELNRERLALELERRGRYAA